MGWAHYTKKLLAVSTVATPVITYDSLVVRMASNLHRMPELHSCIGREYES